MIKFEYALAMVNMPNGTDNCFHWYADGLYCFL